MRRRNKETWGEENREIKREGNQLCAVWYGVVYTHILHVWRDRKKKTKKVREGRKKERKRERKKERERERKFKELTK